MVIPLAQHEHKFMVEITGINIAIGGRGEVDQEPIFLSFLVNIAHFGGLLQNILERFASFASRGYSQIACSKKSLCDRYSD